MTNFITSLIRTQVPIAVGALLAWLTLKTGIVVDESSQAGLVQAFTAILTGLYYLVIRWLETRFPQIGWLLGVPKAPGYSAQDAPPAQPAPGVNEDI